MSRQTRNVNTDTGDDSESSNSGRSLERLNTIPSEKTNSSLLPKSQGSFPPSLKDNAAKSEMGTAQELNCDQPAHTAEHSVTSTVEQTSQTEPHGACISDSAQDSRGSTPREEAKDEKIPNEDEENTHKNGLKWGIFRLRPDEDDEPKYVRSWNFRIIC